MPDSLSVFLLEEMTEHVDDADRVYGSFASSHEALGVLVEEMKELTDAIHANALESIRDEAIDLAAAAMRLARDCRENDEFTVRSTGRTLDGRKIGKG